MQVVLQAIEEGQISLIHAPPEYYTDAQDLEARQNWIKQFLCFRAPSKKEALSKGIKAFLEHPMLSSGDSHFLEMEKVVTTDLLRMQRQPAVMTSYRRYVIVNAEMEGLRWSGDHLGVCSFVFVAVNLIDPLTRWSGQQLGILTFKMNFIQSRL